ncbi:MAG: Transcriptional activator of acetoin dehydrogenase operon AcoR [Hydrocarboniphaga sp.]|uniref:sigma-54-dependent Fis family transcriptional regulator n=1 Tax=Hydrocarboniphaga sp. TaxID=2033016 RepID=UPI002609299E|nr:sigma-54-dependent Fis family transcriptional regulator [Hydrocarboniphaga sp.]MDB5970263.1 Transcriptional activator of acetoin dehydrogenase operon AcoR [Hydrocarboniphaga sp.]
MGDTALMQHARGVLGLVNGLGTPPRAIIEKSVKSSWQRCVNDYRLDPARSQSTCVVDSNNLKELQGQHDELVDIARAEMDTLYDQISGSGYALLLTDTSGIILTEKIDPTLTTMFRSAGLIVGANWSEQTEGTNGIGTCIAEGRSITIHRADHFRARHIGLSCSGSPIRDPSGAMVAVLDASVVGSHDTRSSQMHTMALVNTSARLIEKCLFLRRCQPYRILRFHSRPEFVNLLHDAALALADDGTIVAADDMAVALLAVQGRGALVGSQVGDLFDVGEAELAQLGSTRQALFPVRDLRLGRRFFISLVPAQRAAQLIEVHYGRRSTEAIHITPLARPPVMTLADLAGDDPDMLRNIRAASRVVESQVPILIQGPTGSGKEVFAKAMHLSSARAARPFVAVNCGAIPETLIESELFGYRPGAFTGARKEGSRGYILQSSGGTLFLDEIGDMPLNLQTRLLRVLEEQEVLPLGSDTPIKVELRVISASHRRLREMIRAGEFREDLYYRLNGMTLELPALQDRGDKERVIRQLIAAEAGHAVSIEAPAFSRLMSYPWPGNIRELRNVVRTALAICEGGVVRMGDLPSELRLFNAAGHPDAASTTPERAWAPTLPVLPVLPAASASENPLLAAERIAILQAVENCRWNMTLTARQLGMSRNTLYRKLKRHDIAVGESRRDEVSRS